MGNYVVADLCCSFHQSAGVHIITLRGLLNILNFQTGTISSHNGTGIGNLSTAFSVEGSLIQNDQNALLLSLVSGDGIQQLSAIGNRHQNRLVFQSLIAGKAGSSSVEVCKQVLGPTGNITRQSVLTSLVLLFFHLNLEVLLINLDALFSRNFLGKINGKTKGIIQLECIDTGQNGFLACLSRLLDVLNQARQNIHALINGLVEALFLGSNDFLNVIGMLFQFGIASLILVNNSLDQFGQEGTVYA
ncbi:hypothetical protein EVA_07383 [gut metagenome]|uniref:Uncharacterized protein n=1 Tax=gut metagenome TaxID=749906 RepID=J9GB08_9ZZZZ